MSFECVYKNKKILRPIGAGFNVNLKMKIKKLTVNVIYKLQFIHSTIHNLIEFNKLYLKN